MNSNGSRSGMPCALCNAIVDRGDRHQNWCPLSGNPTQPDAFEFQQSVKAALPLPESHQYDRLMRVRVFVQYVDGKPKAFRVGKVPDAPRGEFRQLPHWYPAWVAADIVDKVMTKGELTHPGQDYRTIGAEDNLRHMLEHVQLLITGDTSEPHLEHIITRAAMAYDRNLADFFGEAVT